MTLGRLHEYSGLSESLLIYSLCNKFQCRPRSAIGSVSIATTGLISLIPACPHFFVEIDREIISAILLLFRLLSVCAQRTG